MRFRGSRSHCRPSCAAGRRTSAQRPAFALGGCGLQRPPHPSSSILSSQPFNALSSLCCWQGRAGFEYPAVELPLGRLRRLSPSFRSAAGFRPGGLRPSAPPRPFFVNSFQSILRCPRFALLLASRAGFACRGSSAPRPASIPDAAPVAPGVHVASPPRSPPSGGVASRRRRHVNIRSKFSSSVAAALPMGSVLPPLVGIYIQPNPLSTCTPPRMRVSPEKHSFSVPAGLTLLRLPAIPRPHSPLVLTARE